MEKTGLQRNWVRSLLTVLTTAVMALIFCFSMEPAEQSDKTSGILARQMIRALYPEYDHYPETQQTELYDSIQAVVRKTALFSEYCSGSAWKAGSENNGGWDLQAGQAEPSMQGQMKSIRFRSRGELRNGQMCFWTVREF